MPASYVRPHVADLLLTSSIDRPLLRRPSDQWSIAGSWQLSDRARAGLSALHVGRRDGHGLGGVTLGAALAYALNRGVNRGP